MTCWVDDDGDAARQAARAVVAFNSTVATYRPVLAHHGFDADADRIRDAWRRGDLEAMSAAVSDEMLEAIAIAGTPDEVRDAVRAPSRRPVRALAAVDAVRRPGPRARRDRGVQRARVEAALAEDGGDPAQLVPGQSPSDPP